MIIIHCIVDIHCEIYFMIIVYMYLQKSEKAESKISSLQEENFELQPQLNLLQAENVLVDQHRENERCDIAIQTDEVSSYIHS